MQHINHGVQAGGNISFQNSNVSFNAGQGSNTLEDECFRSLAIGTMEARDDLPERTPSTGEWVLSHPTYCSWRKEGGLLWIQGRPGTGKSMLLDFLIETERERCSPQDTTVLSFFFEHSGRPGERYDLKTTMFRSLCYQLIRGHRHLLSHFMTSTNFASKSQICNETGIRYVWKSHELLSWLGVAMKELLPKGHSILVFIDALNELGPGSAAETAEQFRTTAGGHPRGLFFCVACHKFLSDGSEPELDDDHVVSCQDEHQIDIRMYVDAQLPLKPGTADHQQLQISKFDLIARANGVFQWLKWSMQRAKTLTKDGEDIANVAQQMRGHPRELHGVYQQMLESLCDGELESAHYLFGCLALAGGAILAEDLRHGVCLDDRRHYSSCLELKDSPQYCESNQLILRRIERLSRGLVRSCRIESGKLKRWPTIERLSCAPEELQVLHFDHDSVQDYMLVNGLRLLEMLMNKPMMSISERRGKMAVKLLAFLHAGEVIEYVSSNILAEEGEAFGPWCYRPRSTLLAEPALAEFAAIHWSFHAAAAENDVSTMQDLCAWFRTSTTRDWSHLARIQEMTTWGFSSKACTGSTLLCVLSQYGLAGVLSAILDSNVLANLDVAHLIEAGDAASRTPLFLAADYGRPEIAKVLLKHGANVNSRSVQRLTPLHRAALRGHVDVAKVLLLQQDVEVDALDRCNETPLHFATKFSNAPAIELLLPRTKLGVHSPGSSACGEFREEWSQWTPLGLGFQLCSATVLKLLLESFGPLDTAEESNTNSILHVLSTAKAYCHWDFETKADILINSGIFDVNWVGKDGQTPLFTAIRYDAFEVVKLLLQRTDVQVDQIDDHGVTPLLLAVFRRSLGSVKMLLDSQRVQVNKVSNFTGGTALHGAVHFEANDIVAALLSHGTIRPDAANQHRDTPLLEAVRSRSVVAAKALSDTGNVDMNIRDVAWNPPVHLAIDSDFLPLLKVFLDAERTAVDLNATDSLGFPPLIRAVRRGKLAIVMSLLMKDQIHVVDSLGAMPLMVSFARDEFQRNPTSRERETILALLQCLGSNDAAVPSVTYRAVQEVFSGNEESVTFSEILESLDFARGFVESMQKAAAPQTPATISDTAFTT